MKKFIDESWLVLVMGIVFAALLAGTQTVMLPKIEKNEAAETLDAIAEVVPQADLSQKPKEIDLESLGIVADDLKIEKVKIYRCQAEDGGPAGWAVKATGPGFIDKIDLVIGLTPDGGKLLGIKAVKHTETPGLGNRIDTKGDENPYPLQYAGKDTSTPLSLVKGQAGQPHEIQAITGATYSSQYVMDIVNEVTARIVPALPKD